MAEIIQETITTEKRDIEEVDKDVKRQRSAVQTIAYIIYFLVGILEVLLFFRIVLLLTGANRANGFVDLIYSITGVFILPFEGIFRNFYTEGIETTSVLEPASLVAVIVYPLLAYAIVRLVKLIGGRKPVT